MSGSTDPQEVVDWAKGICVDFCDPPCLLLAASLKATSQHLAHIHFSSRWTRLSSGQSLAPAFGVFIYRSQNRFFLSPSAHSPGKGWSWLVSVAVISTKRQQPVEERDISSYKSQVTVHHEGKPGAGTQGRNPKAGTEAEAMER